MHVRAIPDERSIERDKWVPLGICIPPQMRFHFLRMRLDAIAQSRDRHTPGQTLQLRQLPIKIPVDEDQTCRDIIDTPCRCVAGRQLRCRGRPKLRPGNRRHIGEAPILIVRRGKTHVAESGKRVLAQPL